MFRETLEQWLTRRGHGFGGTHKSCVQVIW